MQRYSEVIERSMKKFFDSLSEKDRRRYAAVEVAKFHTIGIVKSLMEKTQTSTRLRVTVDILDKVYEVGRQCAKGFKQNMKIVFDSFLPKWNYRAISAVT